MRYRKLSTFLGALAVIAVLVSVALTFAQPYQFTVKEDTSMENHEECEEIMEQMHEECIDMMNEMHHNNHSAQMNNETRESQGHHGCH
jgi:Na+/H+ antiporter NhaB